MLSINLSFRYSSFSSQNFSSSEFRFFCDIWFRLHFCWGVKKYSILIKCVNFIIYYCILCFLIKEYDLFIFVCFSLTHLFIFAWVQYLVAFRAFYWLCIQVGITSCIAQGDHIAGWVMNIEQPHVRKAPCLQYFLFSPTRKLFWTLACVKLMESNINLDQCNWWAHKKANEGGKSQPSIQFICLKRKVSILVGCSFSFLPFPILLLYTCECDHLF